MSNPKRYVMTASTLEEALASLGKLPGVLNQAFKRWRRIRFIVEEYQEKRSPDQNRLQRLWCKEAAAQGDTDAEYWRGYCKFHFGLKILCRDSDEYRAACKRVLGQLNYEQQIELMMEPHDYPVTRAMTKKQKTEYLDMCWQFFTGKGYRLTDPATRGMEDWRQAA